jgi:hypothetical protein
MSHDERPGAGEGRPEGQDHREGPPGHDLDEQSAIRELAEEQGEGGAEGGEPPGDG